MVEFLTIPQSDTGDVIPLFPESQSMLQEITHCLRFFGQLIQYPLH